MGRILLLLLVVSITTSTIAQKKYAVDYTNLQSYAREAARIMRIYSMNIRSSLALDLHKVVVTTDPALKEYESHFDPKGIDYPKDSNMAVRYYKNPTIVISKAVDKVLRRERDTTIIGALEAKATLIHEMTHFLQETFGKSQPMPTTTDELEAYIREPAELESFLVESYFFVENYNPKKLQEILQIYSNGSDQAAALIN